MIFHSYASLPEGWTTQSCAICAEFIRAFLEVILELVLPTVQNLPKFHQDRHREWKNEVLVLQNAGDATVRQVPIVLR